MEFILSNPWGLLGLIGIPAVLLIHFLQRQSQEVTVSTLFLLEQMQRESVEGRRFEKLRSSVPLWLQLLMVLLLTWLLIQPRWLKSDSVQPLAVVLDSSASMSAFEEEATESLMAELRDLAGSVGRTEFYVMESSLAAGNLYRGMDLEKLQLALDEWNPTLGEHDFTPALRVARNLVGRQGLVILVTDHTHKELTFDATLLAAGDPKPNVGFAGLRVSEDESGAPRWTAMVRNYSDDSAEREWYLASGSQRSTPQTVRLAAGEIRSIEGPFPENVDQATLHLANDDFTPDDVLPMIRPRPRELLVRTIVAPALAEQAAQVAKSLGNTRVLGPGAEAPADLTIATYDPLNPALPEGNAIVFMAHPLRQNQVVKGELIVENHPLVEHLNWQPLIVRRSLQIPRRETDQVLLWQAERPLIFLRQESGTRQLLFNFDLEGSNALKLPAFIVLAHRFAESIRAEKPALERRILETGQPLALAPPQNAEPAPFRFYFRSWDGDKINEREVSPDDLALLRAPLDPGFLTVRYGEEKLLEASTFFADTREADLRNATTENRVSGVEETLVERHSEVDANWMVWLLLLAALLVLSWAWIAWRQSRIQGNEAAEAAVS